MDQAQCSIGENQMNYSILAETEEETNSFAHVVFKHEYKNDALFRVMSDGITIAPVRKDGTCRTDEQYEWNPKYYQDATDAEVKARKRLEGDVNA